MTDLTHKKKIELFEEHKCPECGSCGHLISYFPNLDSRQEVNQEVECENCGFYLEFTYNIDEIKVINIK